MIDVNIMQDASEVIPYDNPKIPLYIQTRYLSTYPDMRALCHWHDEIAFIYILSGKMYYEINGKKVLLNEKDCIMVNARQMHYGSSVQKQECEFLCILFHPSLLSASRLLYQDYVLPVIESRTPEYLLWESNTQKKRDVTGFLTHIAHLKESAVSGYELEVIGALHALWRRIYGYCQSLFPTDSGQESSDIALSKTMVSYIYQHYSDKITLDEIATSGNVCRSKCCAIFRRYLQQSPIDFLNAYRLRVSSSLLKNTELDITQIALSCGFNHLSYFSKLFLRYYGCTPSQYRKS